MINFLSKMVKNPFKSLPDRLSGTSGGEWLLNAHSGQLQLNLAKENYERSGLAGQAVKDGGRKHLKTRFGTSVTDGRCSSTYL